MSMFLQGRAWKGALAVLGALSVAAGVMAATTSGAAKPTYKVDHQLCYTASGKFAPPTGSKVTLFNQFAPNGFTPVLKPYAVMHCNPVLKVIKTSVGQKSYVPTNPRAHLACVPMSLPLGTTQKLPKVYVKNQFGAAVLYLSQPNLFCLPSWKSLTGPPNLKPTTPPGLNHFTCYPVKDFSNGAYKPPGAVYLRDEFSSTLVPVQVNPIPKELCLPTKKVIQSPGTGTKIYPILDPVTHLLCFQVTKTPFKPKVWDENQFGTSVMTITATKWLCLPSTKKVLP